MDKQVVFKTSAVGGFNKKAVLDYIYRLNEESSTILTQVREENDELAKVRQSLEESVNQLNGRILTLQRELDEAKRAISRESSRANELAAENDVLQGEVLQQREQITQVRRELGQCEHEKEEIVAKTRELQAHKDEADIAVAGIGKIMLNAQIDADRILSEANTQSDEIVSYAKAEAEELRGEAQSMLENARADVNAEAERMRLEAQSEAGEILTNAEQRAKYLAKEADAAAHAISERFNSYSSLAEKIQASIAKMLADYSEQSAALTKEMQTASAEYEKTIEEIQKHEELKAPVVIYTEDADDDSNAEENPSAWPHSAWVQPGGEAVQEEADDEDFFRSAADR